MRVYKGVWQYRQLSGAYINIESVDRLRTHQEMTASSGLVRSTEPMMPLLEEGAVLSYRLYEYLLRL